MTGIVNKRNLFCNEWRALTLLECKHDMSLLKQQIKMTEEAVAKKKPSDDWSFEGICHMFAKASVAHAKMAYDNMVLGHNDAANMILRAFIENCVSFEVIFDHEEEGLWRYYLVQSYRDTIVRPDKDTPEKDRLFLEDMYQRYGIGDDFLQKNGKKKAFIDMPYGWTYKINKNFNAEGFCNLVDEDDRMGSYTGFKMMSPYSHGTSLRNMLSGSSSLDQVMSMISTLYFFLFHLAYLYCLDSMNERYDAVTEELEWRLYKYFNLIEED